MTSFVLTEEIIERLKEYRHEVRYKGTLGACYQMAWFVEHHYGLPMKEGIYQSDKLEPIISHRWNILPDGSILETTGDQFCEGVDIAVLGKDHPLYKRYRPQWSDSLNPTITPWLKQFDWLGVSDAKWKRDNPDKKVTSGFWLEDNSDYLKWREEMAEKYEAYRA